MHRVEWEIKRLVDEVGYARASELFAKLSGGKRLRAKLILLIADTHPKAPLLAAIVELIHAASLLHDDVIDEATTRRGVTSINASNGSKVAVMLGDILYSKAYSELVGFDEQIAKAVASAVTKLSVGEMIDVELSNSFSSDEEIYLEMLYLKTASLIEACALCAALLAGKDPKPYAIYGKNLGLSFQMIDDILDITSDEQTLGKPAMNDFSEGKTTLPYIYLYEALDADEKSRLISYHQKSLDSDSKEWIKAKMSSSGALQKAFDLAKKVSNEAMVATDDSRLASILDTMIKRSY